MSVLAQSSAGLLRDQSAANLLNALRSLETSLRPLHELSRLLPALTARGNEGERLRLVQALQDGKSLQPQLMEYRVPKLLGARNRVDTLLREVEWLPLPALYGARLEEIALELAMLDQLGQAKVVRPLAVRRYGSGQESINVDGCALSLRALARRILDAVETAPCEPRVLPASAGRNLPSLSALMQACMAQARLDGDVVVDSRLVAGAAAGERTVFVAAGPFGICEATRLCVHEVLGHLTAAANGRAQSLRILEWGTADSFTDQEGLALFLEDSYGVLDSRRLRILAARVLATVSMHEGATFTAVARALHHDEGLAVEDAVAVTQRAFRGGGVARDTSYLLGFVRVSRAFQQGTATLDALRAGRLSLAALPHVAHLEKLGLARSSIYRPNLARSFFSTKLGTTPCKLPPNAAASLISEELTKK